MLNLGTIWDDDSGPEAVEILHDMIARNLPYGTEGRLICFTNKTDPLPFHIARMPLDADRHGVTMIPLNCCVIRKLDMILEGKQVPTAFYDGSFPADVSLVVWPDGQGPKDADGWVKHVWKIGGGTSVEIEYIPNVPKPKLGANMRHALGLDCRWFTPQEPHENIAIIVGGAPSLDDDMLFLRMLSQEGVVFAINGVPAYLESRGIVADVHVMLDAHPDCIKFVSPNLPMTRYYASQCDPAVLDAAGKTLVCWHGGGEAIEELPGVTFRHVVGGGSTAATRAMVLAYGLGYRKIHLFGLDSSFDDKVHAYDQRGYERTVNVTCGETTFKTSPQLLGQAEDFKLVAPDLVAAGCEIVVHGSGLLQSLATQMAA